MAIDQEDTDERLPDSVLNSIINMVARDYLRRRESKLGEASVAFTTTPNMPDYAVPAGFSKARKVWYLSPDSGAIVVVKFMDKDLFDTTYPYSSLLTLDGAGDLILEGGGFLELEGGGQLKLEGFSNIGNALDDPVHFTIWRGKIVFGYCPDRSITTFVDYYKILPDLADGAPDNTNRFIEEGWEYLLFGSLVKASEFGFEDDRLPIWQAEMAKLEMSLDLEDTRQKTTARRSQSSEPG